jgi:hypothetical protein
MVALILASGTGNALLTQHGAGANRQEIGANRQEIDQVLRQVSDLHSRLNQVNEFEQKQEEELRILRQLQQEKHQ